MKMVKSLLLGTAAGLVAMTGAQAADLPVKAKPVQYVKICSLYGAGFYYIPGTDTCLKIGGYVRVQAEAGAGNGGTPNIVGGTQGSNTVYTNNYGYRTRGLLSADARSQTEYGTLRSYFNLQMEHNDGGAPSGNAADAFNIDSAYIQFAGFTAGLANSFYNFLSFAGYNYGNTQMSGDSGALGNPLLAYTAQLGGGLSASISLEDAGHKTAGVLDAGTGGIAATALATATPDNGGNRIPDVVANLRIDQAWGSAQVMGATHVVSSGYQTVQTTHPSDETGYAVGAGISLNVPNVGVGDVFAIQGNYAKGALRYVTGNAGMGKQNGSTLGYGYVLDGVFGATGDTELTTGWSVGAVYQHGWSRTLKTSLYGGYVAINYNDAANALICTDMGVGMTPATGCNNDWSFWQVGSRTAWAPVANLEIGLDILYTKLNTASAGAVGFTGGALTTSNAALSATSIADQDVWSAMLRIQRSFYP